jgi:hypothetical protein
VTALGLVVAGCSSEDPQQEAAREEVQRHVGTLSGYDVEEIHCTDAAGVWFRDIETDQFTCAARRLEGGCDWFAVQVDRDRGLATVRLAQRDAGCTLGF